MSNDNFNCPFCHAFFPKIDSSYRVRTPSFSHDDSQRIAFGRGENIKEDDHFTSTIAVEFALCPACGKTTIRITGLGKEVTGIKQNFHPFSNAKQYPKYIPISIRKDYEEASQIVNLSPKASATLSRRCLQGMIRDFWEISGKKNLYEEILAIQDKIDPQVAKVLNGVRKIGNIGAHMEKDINLIIDIDPGEANQLIKLIEYLMEQWYIKRHETNELLNSILTINGEKQEQRKN